MVMSPLACHLLSVPMPRGPQTAGKATASKPDGARREEEINVLRARANTLVAE
jgi:hypothetical protein